MKNNFIMDADLAARFISTLTKSLQAVLHGCLDCENDIELGGYVYLRIDNAQRVDYVLSEKMQKSNVNSMTFHSNSFHALPLPGQANKHSERNLEPSAPLERQADVFSTASNENANIKTLSHSNNAAASVASTFSRRHNENIAQAGMNSSGSLLLSSRANDRTHHSSSNLQPSFQSPPHGFGKQSAIPLASGNMHAFSQNGSSGRHVPSSGPLPHPPQQLKSSILPDASEIEVVHIKTEDDDVFSIPLPCQQGGSGTDGLAAQNKWLSMRSRHSLLYNPYPRISRSHSWDYRLSSPAEGFRFPLGTDASLDGGDNLSLTCKLCGKSYRSRQGLLFHERAKHQNVFNVYCPVCGKGFQQTTHMYGHMATHTNVKHFGCQACGARYAHKTSLQQHVRSGACRAQHSIGQPHSSPKSSLSPSTSAGLDLSSSQLFREFPSYGTPGPSSNQSPSEPESPVESDFTDPKGSRMTPQGSFEQQQHLPHLNQIDLTNPECTLEGFSREVRPDRSTYRNVGGDMTDAFGQSSCLDLTMEDKGCADTTRQCDGENQYREGHLHMSGLNLTSDHQSQMPRSGSSQSGYSADDPHSLPHVSRPTEHSHFSNEDMGDPNADDDRHSPDGGGGYNYSQDSDDPPATVSLSLSADDD